jgi:hypothetical protein
LTKEEENKSIIEQKIDTLQQNIAALQERKVSSQNNMESNSKACSKTMGNMRNASLAKTPSLDDARKALSFSPQNSDGDWSKSLQILQDVNLEFTPADCREIVGLTKQLSQTTMTIRAMERLKTVVENLEKLKNTRSRLSGTALRRAKAVYFS